MLSTSLTKCFSSLIVLNFCCFRPYLMDLGSTNGTFINVSLSLNSILPIVWICMHMSVWFLWIWKIDHVWSQFSFHFSFNIFSLCFQDSRIEPQRYYELFEKDTIKFGNSRYAMSKDIFFDCCDLLYYSFHYPCFGM